MATAVLHSHRRVEPDKPDYILGYWLLIIFEKYIKIKKIKNADAGIKALLDINGSSSKGIAVQFKSIKKVVFFKIIGVFKHI